MKPARSPIGSARPTARVLVVDDHAMVRAGVVLKDSEPGELLARVRRLAFEVV